jgi:ABC-type nitrate/sulfonate/bicarbonate transport system substrate-binding protein
MNAKGSDPIEQMTRRDALQMGAGLGAALVTSSLLFERSAYAAGPLQKFNIVSTSGALVIGQLMKNKGYLQDFGIDGTIQAVSDGTKALGALVGGDADIVVGTGFGQVLTAIEKGAKVKILAGAGMLNDAAIYTKKADIKTCKDLEGRTVGVGALGALLHQIIVAMLKSKGVDPNKVTFVNVGSVVDVYRAVSAGVVDAGPGPADIYDQLGKLGLYALSDGRLWTEIPDYTNQATYTTDKTLVERRDLIVRTLAAYSRLYRFIQEDDSFADFAVARAQANGKDDREAALSQWKFYRDYKMFATDLVLSEQRFKFMQTLNIDSGAQTAMLAVNQISDMGPAQEAVKLARAK